MKKVLVIRFSSLGDVILTTGIIKYVKETLKDDINIDILTFTSFAGIFNNFPFINDIYCINKGASFSELTDTIRKMPEYDIIIDLHANLRSFIVKLIMSAPSYTYKKNSLLRRFFVKTKIGGNFLSKHTIEKYYTPFQKSLNLPNINIDTIKPYLKPLSNDKDDSIKHIVIHPFASKTTKEWPFYLELAKLLTEQGIKVTIIGSNKINIPNNINDETGNLPLQKLINIIASADLLVTTDSGPMHIGIALNTPTLAIFGSTTKELGFYPKFTNTKVIENIGLKCRPCHIHGNTFCKEKHFKCMVEIGTEEVRTYIMNMLKG